LITRPEPGASQTARKLTELGLVPILAPVLSIKSCEVDPPEHVGAVVLTSGNAVQACPEAMHSYPVFAVGTATAARTIQAGFRHVFNADGDATSLANLIADTISPADGTLFLPTAQRQGGKLATSLRERGFRVTRRIAYQVSAVETLPRIAFNSLRHGQVAAAMFFSGETSRHFVRLLRSAGLIDTVQDVEAVSISERAAMALGSLPWRRIRVAAKPNQDAMLALLQ